MRRMLKAVLLFFCATGCLALVSCHDRSNHDTFYLVAPNLKLPYWKTVQDGFKQAAKEYGVTPVIAGPENYDPAAEASAFSDAVGRHPAGILVSAAAASALHADIASAIGQGIPVITVDSDAPFSERLFFIGTNNLQIGHLGGQRVVSRLKGKGNVVFYTIPGQPNLDERMRGYEEAFSNSDIKVVGIVATGGESGNAFDQTEQYVHRSGNDRVAAFICLESEAGKAVAEVLKRNHMTDRELMAMDVDPETLNLIADGTIDATVSQRPWTMGYAGLKALDAAFRSPHTGGWEHDYSVNFRSPFPAFIDTGTALITKDNVGMYQQAPQTPPH